MQFEDPVECSILESFLHFKGENSFIANSSLENDEATLLNLSSPFLFPPSSIDSTNEEILPKDIILKDFPEFEESKDSNIFILKKKRKRGRKNDKEKPQHTEFKNDNKMAKIQVSYFSF